MHELIRLYAVGPLSGGGLGADRELDRPCGRASQAGMLSTMLGLGLMALALKRLQIRRSLLLGSMLTIGMVVGALWGRGAAESITTWFRGLADAGPPSGLVRNVLERFDYWRVSVVMFRDPWTWPRVVLRRVIGDWVCLPR